MARTASPRSKKEMIEFLKSHFRYHTMNSWNRATSYARTIKIYSLGLDHETEQRCFEMLEISEAFHGFSAVLDDFALRHGYQWQIGQNGRSGGYLVLYQGGKKDAGYKSRCDTCFRLTWYETRQRCHAEGCGGMLEVLKEPVWQSFTCPGRGVDDDADYESMSYGELCSRVALIRDFDRTCESAVQAFLDYAMHHKVTEQEILVPKTVKVAVSV